MLFALLCTDKPNSLDTRLAVRPDHVAYLASLGNAMKAAGPFLDDTDKPNGSLVIIEATDLANAKAIAANDPYAKAGLFSSVEIKPWRWVLKNPDQA
ncbi:MAG: YciI family protein [Alphaproteobacteria bacterium]|nr:YciI family protein [Alphaproteobacteria bacterium]